MNMLLLIFVFSFLATFLIIPRLIPGLIEADLTGKDRNKEGFPVVPEMGGLGIVAGFVVGVLLMIALTTFDIIPQDVSLIHILAALSTILIMSLIGIIDDLFIIKQHIKAMLPLFAALPLVAVKAGVTSMTMPFFGTINFSIFYILILIPIAIAGASNATNMLAGFNGLEAGLGVVIFSTILIVSYMTNNIESMVISLAMLGSLLAFLYYNWYPAKILIGDVGTLSIGAAVATSVIIGNIEKVGIILILPFFAELILKMRSRFKAESWCEVKGKLLICPSKDEVYGLGRLVMYLAKGITEEKLVLTIIGIEAIFGVIAILSYI